MPKIAHEIITGRPFVMVDDGDIPPSPELIAARESRSRAVADFLLELTQLSRRHGLVIEIERHVSHGESYEYLVLSPLSQGTETFWYLGEDDHLLFDAFPNRRVFQKKKTLGTNLSLSKREIDCFQKVKAARAREDHLFDSHDRQLRDLQAQHQKMADAKYWADEKKRTATWPKRRPRCRCGLKFRSEKALIEHCQKTGHAEGF